MFGPSPGQIIGNEHVRPAPGGSVRAGVVHAGKKWSRCGIVPERATSVNSAIGLIQCGYCMQRTAQFEDRSSVILPAIPERVETFILTITSRRKAFTVFGLMFIREAISLLVSP